MKILCCSLWNNSWIPYWHKFFKDNGHEVKWKIGAYCSYKKVRDEVEWCDVILCHWAIGWSTVLSKLNLGKPLFVIHRSFEVFEDTIALGKVTENDWNNINQLFMLNESHFPFFNTKVKNVQPVFIKNGVNTGLWSLINRDEKAKHNIAWIANINHKKGEMLAVQAIAALQKIDPIVLMQHLGKIDSQRIFMYMQNIAPHLKAFWNSYGWVEGHQGVKLFMADKANILCSSLVEGHPMNIIEGMSTGMKPLIHRYPGVEHQFPEKWIWNDFKQLKELYLSEYKPEEYRQYIIDNYDYKKTCMPVLKAMECTKS